MNLVVDSNILISGIITPDGTISKLIIRDLRESKIICPELLLIEFVSKLDKLEKATNLTRYQLNELFYKLTKGIDFIAHDLIEFRYQKQAYELVKNVDKKDLLFVALSLMTGYPLWTGDKKLIAGLKQNGFQNLLETDRIITKL